MKHSKLLSSLVRGKWMISYEESMAKSAVVKNLLEGDFSTENVNVILSDEKPIASHVFAFSGNNGDSYDNAPEDSIAVISIKGTMLKYGTYCSYGTVEIAAEFNKAANHKNISAIVLYFDSGGGAVDAIAPLTDAINRCSKPVVASCDLCASAAYWVASCCDRIIANNNISAEFGSIGVMVRFMDVEPYYKEMGVVTHTIYSTHSDYKNRPFEQAKAGNYEEIKTEELDPLAVKFQNQVKSARKNLKTETPGVIQGRMFGPEQAKEIGLIDDIGSMDVAVQTARDLVRDATISNYLKL